MRRTYRFLPLLLGAALSLTGSTYAQQAERKGIPWYIWLLIIVVLVAFAVLAYRWWVSGREEEEVKAPAAKWEAPPAAVRTPEVKVEPPKVGWEAPALDVRAAEVEVEAPKVEMELPLPSAPAVPDDLKLIEGIGPKIASVLNSAGILTFGQLAATDADHIKEILEKADPRLLRLADPTTWPEQAGHAAAGDWEAFRTLQDTLKGGRRS